MSKEKEITPTQEEQKDQLIPISEIEKSINIISDFLYNTIPAKFYNENIKPILQSEFDRINGLDKK